MALNSQHTGMAEMDRPKLMMEEKRKRPSLDLKAFSQPPSLISKLLMPYPYKGRSVTTTPMQREQSVLREGNDPLWLDLLSGFLMGQCS